MDKQASICFSFEISILKQLLPLVLGGDTGDRGRHFDSLLVWSLLRDTTASIKCALSRIATHVGTPGASRLPLTERDEEEMQSLIEKVKSKEKSIAVRKILRAGKTATRHLHARLSA